MIPCSKIMRGERSVHNERKTGPLFVWNIISRCNLLCSHCYRDSQAGMQVEDLSDKKCLELVSQIKAVNPPIVLLTGGEPLLRKNIFEIIKECKKQDLRVGLSTNGTLINQAMAQKIKAADVDYVGISIDGKKEHHDKFRGAVGAYDSSWAGLKILNELGVKTGVRFTLTAQNSVDLMDILDKTVASGCKRFCLYHLVYAGRASKDLDMKVEDKRKILSTFFKKVKVLSKKDPSFDVLTTDNPADGIFMSTIIDDGKDAMDCIMAHGGCSAGDRVVYLDSTGDVYPCQFLRDHSLGNVKDKTFMEIWEDHSNEFLQQLRNKQGLLQGVCGECAHKGICGGCRARAKAFYGSLWAQDPGCYLKEIEVRPKQIL
ncbi:MAG: radical SAM protein [Candidatus Omnitrophica bacterium]|nr:radical SAM protein [Candidatus Omnitrophota bacterium]